MDSFTLARCLRLHDPELLTVPAHLSLQDLVLLWAVEGRWHEVEVLVSVEGLHARIPLIQAVLPRDLIAAWKVINLLEASQVAVDVRLDNGRAPDQHHCIAVQEVAVTGVRYVVKVARRHPVILHRLFEPLLLQNPPDQSVLEVSELVIETSPCLVLPSEPALVG